MPRIRTIEKGLARTKREYVNESLQTIEWPPEETKQRKTHVLPLGERAWRLVLDWQRERRSWCPYLFHGPQCSPLRQPSKAYGCVGDFKKAWKTAGAGEVHAMTREQFEQFVEKYADEPVNLTQILLLNIVAVLFDISEKLDGSSTGVSLGSPVSRLLH